MPAVAKVDKIRLAWSSKLPANAALISPGGPCENPRAIFASRRRRLAEGNSEQNSEFIQGEQIHH